ncbi:MAG: S-methyl-5'-thioinosine phosphorylase [Gammaproteobacteria bacterium]|nr:S-methyl-5'-thioinosine phosphorylase [Gammaproteobacteria bacterium]NIR32851.1 S-methyl-5'-thioinosine phosphorylase [Gammaproteobacteria bacterium]NIR99398.1 S-methyl-5'-thioinosine phosphorylase [Gammaproteobacteria bacterium]NIT65012.1 S-methyl-5'-thioinosine phosphorylase [Gammaproteobacteria bacterium]NIV21926.1 S-methyl-5'-thioinosine phosphorylase [Gammaproteobacteria bacterium]
MTDVAIIGGTGLSSLKNLEITHREMVQTPYGAPSGPAVHGRVGARDVVFLPRHGSGHTIPPHKVNYRANIWALKSLGVEKVVAVAAVGGITSRMAPGMLAFPDQIIDYTWGRETTYFSENLDSVTHIDFTYPYCAELRDALIKTARAVGFDPCDRATYGATQGPRLETAAEIRRLERDGCDMVGMTGMPEAALARELGLCYATCAVVGNWAAGKGEGIITMDEIERHLKEGMDRVRLLIEHALKVI